MAIRALECVQENRRQRHQRRGGEQTAGGIGLSLAGSGRQLNRWLARRKRGCRPGQSPTEKQKQNGRWVIERAHGCTQQADESGDGS